MNAQELYNYITLQITAEQALMKMLESSLITYEKLKFNKGEELHPVMVISLAAMDMDWALVVEKDLKNIEGLMVGTKEYIKRNRK